MCTLILGRDVLGPGTVILAANRDEDPSRPSDPPLVLSDSPRVAGGRDRVAGGTWLAVRAEGAAVALLNRRPTEGAAPEAPLRSRGLLTLDAARATPASGESLADAVASHVRASLAHQPFAPFSMVFASAAACWWWRGVPDEPASRRKIGAGWHVITHEDLDDPGEPRTAWLREDLHAFAPRDPDEAIAGLHDRLRVHGNGKRVPAVCIHEGPMRTVSTSIVWFANGESRYLHVEGRPCVGKPVDRTSLLAGAPAPEIP